MEGHGDGYYYIASMGQGKYATQNGTIDLSWDSDKAIKSMLDLAWQKRNFAMDPRGGKHQDNNVDPAALTRKIVYLAEHGKLNHNPLHRSGITRAALMAAFDVRRLAGE